MDDRASEAALGRGKRENRASAASLVKRQVLFRVPDPERSSGATLIGHTGSCVWLGPSRICLTKTTPGMAIHRLLVMIGR